MKYLYQIWDKENDCILFFFQRLEEMLFHYSNDIFRFPLHNTKTLLQEYIGVENEVGVNKVGSYQLEEIYCELLRSIYNDKILRNYLGDAFTDEIIESIKKDRSQTIHYLNNKISNTKYLSLCKEYLKEHVVVNNRKKEVELGIRAWISMIVYMGYSPEYIYNSIQDDFSIRISEPVKYFNDFIDGFTLKEKTFRVYFSFSPLLNKYKKLFGKRLKVLYDENIKFKSFKRYKNDFVGYLEEKSFDRYSAMKKAYNDINIFLKFYRVISNHKNQLIRNFGVVLDIQDDIFFEMPVKPLGYRSIEVEPNADLTDVIDRIIINCQKKEDTYSKLNRIIDLHNDAIQQPDLKDGFLNLWSILEIVGIDINSNSNIDGVINNISAIIQKDYLINLFYDINENLKDNLKKEDYYNLLENLEGAGYSSGERIAAFIFLEEYEELREEYFEKLKEFPVIRNKIYNLWVMRNTKKEILELTKKYVERVKWHIYRLYRTRNSIVHSGETGYGLQMLGEHLHIYVDGVITELIVKLAQEKNLHTINDVLLDAKLTLRHISNLLNKDGTITAHDIKPLCKDVFCIYM